MTAPSGVRGQFPFMAMSFSRFVQRLGDLNGQVSVTALESWVYPQNLVGRS